MEDSRSSNTYVKVPPDEEIVISGIAGRFPESDNMKQLQGNLLNKVDLGSDDNRRWSNVCCNIPSRTGKVNNGEKFDADYFNIPSLEAHVLDPMSRMLLEHTYEALIDAGVNPKELRGTRTGVFIGTCFSETLNTNLYYKPQVAGFPIIGSNKYWLANSISNWLDLKGPSHIVDTACSSSHYAMAEAYRMIRSGECDAALVGGANLCLHPNISHQYFQLGVLSADGYCKPFDASGMGYMRSEAIVIVYLQKAKDARRVYATFVYAKTNNDGFKQEGITYPSMSMQKELLEQFYNECDIKPQELSYMEAHSTGTPAGDPIEIDVIDQNLCSKRITPLLVGSVKSNLGHTESSSGFCQIAKVLLAMETGIIPPNIHYNTPRKELTAIIEGRIKIITEPTSWNGGYVGINSFGFGGANCHILLKSNPKSKIDNKAADDLPRLVVVSGRTEEAVKILLDDVNNRQLDVEYVALLHRIHAENIEAHSYRGYTIAGSKNAHNIIKKVENISGLRKSICYVFLGTDVTWYNNVELLKLPVFAKTIEKCDAALKQHGIYVTDILTSGNKTTCNSDILKSFVATIAIQIGLVDLLTHIGVVPNYTIGHSIGNLICEYVDGRSTVEETILIAYYIGVVFKQSKIQVADENHYRYTELFRGNLLKEISYRLPPQSSKSRGVIWLNKSCKELDNSSAAAAEYFVDSILYPVSFEKMISLIPKDAVFVEMVPHSALQWIMTKSLESTTMISLCKHSQKNTIKNFLEGIGDFFNIGFQPQISRLYTPVQFPVSRGTSMISPLIKWDHSENYYFYRYKGLERIFNRVRAVNITTANKEYEFMTGHMIDGKNLLPATGYLYLIWEMIGLLRGIDYSNTPIVFENVKFLRASYLSKKDNLELILMCQKDSNNFEIVEGNNVIVSGVARVPDDISSEKLPVQFLSQCDDVEECMKTADIYKELRLRGYQYTDLFCLLKSASITEKVGHINWQTNWVAFMDNMLQMKILSLDSRSLCVPTQIDKLVIDPAYHIMQIRKLPLEKKDLPVRIYDYIDTIVSGGIEISGLKATAVPRRLTVAEAVHEEYRFVAYRDQIMVSLKAAVKISLHIALECYALINVKVIEYIEDNDKILQEDLVTPIVEEVLNNLPLVQSNLTLVATTNRFNSSSLPPNLSIVNNLAKDNAALMTVGIGILTKNTSFTNRLLTSVMAGGFLLSREDLRGTYNRSILQSNNLNIILEKRTERETFVLLRKAQNTVNMRKIVHINNYDFSWIDRLKDAMDVREKLSPNTRIIIVAEGDSECGVLGLVNCLRKESGGEMIGCVFIQDNNAPKFSLEDSFYMKQLQLDLPINVLHSGKVWGSYRHLSLPRPEPRSVQCGYVLQEVRGDLNTLRWVEGRISPCIKRENLIRIAYTALNFKDIMIATSKLALESLVPVGRDVDSLLGFEIVGFDGCGRRIMAVCSNRAISNVLINDVNISWFIPDDWSFEEAATVPCAYATSYYALYMKGKMKKGDKILIHSGAGSVGQAAINLALYEGCEVFTTVGTPQKRQFIKQTFPSIPDDHIGNSHDTSFEQMIGEQTHDRGVDIVLNSLAEKKLQASVRCLAKGGRFLEIGQYDLISNNTLDKTVFARGISFYGVVLDRLICSGTENNEQKEMLHNYILKGLKNGVVKPLPRKVFERTEVEAAFKYMTTGKHIGKVLIKIRHENEPLDHPILAYPRFFCEPHKSYIILGGLGGFGLELADWLILRGARKLLLTSRFGIRNGYQRSKIELWKSYGVNVQIIVGTKASIHDDCAFILNFAKEMGPLDVIFNLALVLKDSFYTDQTAETFRETFQPKAMVTKALDELSRKMCPDLRHFVVFSSVSCGRGNAGQTNYGMANSIIERICEKRAQDGFPGMAIQWGVVGDVGVVVGMQKDNKELVISGILQQNIQSCLQSLDAFLVQNQPIVSSMVVDRKRVSSSGAMNILETVINIMGLKDIKSVSGRITLPEIGMDSMMAVEIEQTLKREFDTYLTTQDIQNLTFDKLRDMCDKMCEN